MSHLDESRYRFETGSLIKSVPITNSAFPCRIKRGRPSLRRLCFRGIRLAGQVIPAYCVTKWGTHSNSGHYQKEVDPPLSSLGRFVQWNRRFSYRFAQKQILDLSCWGEMSNRILHLP